MDAEFVICPNCGSQMPSQALFCGKCGAKIEAIPEPPAMPTKEVEEEKEEDKTSEILKSKVAKAKASLIESLSLFREEHPELLQIFFNNEEAWSDDYFKKMIQTIKKNASERFFLPPVPTAETYVDIVDTGFEEDGDQYIVTPKYLTLTSAIFNFPKSASRFSACRSFSCYLYNLLLMLPVGKLRFHIVDLNINRDFEELFTSKLPDVLYNKSHIREVEELDRTLDALLKKAEATVRSCKDVVAYNKEKKTIRQPYEVVVFLDGCNKYLAFKDKINRLLDFGAKAGLYFIMLDFGCMESPYRFEKILKMEDSLYSDTGDGTPLISSIPLALYDEEKILKYLHEEASAVTEETVRKFDYSDAGDKYVPLEQELRVPIGEDMDFCLNTINHVHSFIIGQSGSGKSVFLHNVIGSVIHRYSPEDLQLYLLDFKLGGVEFNRYKGIKHVKAMLVDNSDQQITLEILRELRESMVERGKLLREAGVANINEYNSGRTSNKMPRVLLVADECHEMFKTDGSIPRAVSSEISEIVTKIAKEGRSQGVHLLLATQTLSGTEISNEILHNITDHYLLKCAPSDSDRMVPGSSDITATQTTGQIYYHHVDYQQQFQSFYINKEEAEKLISAAMAKAESHKSNGEFYFSGSQLFNLNSELLENNRKISKVPVVYLGKSIDLKQKDISINLREDYSENILVFGLNDGLIVTRTMFNLLSSALMASRMGGLDIPVKIINCMTEEDNPYEDKIDDLADAGLCDVLNRRERGAFLKDLAEKIKNETAEPTLLFIFGQERFRELKMDMELDVKKEQEKPLDDFASMLGSFSSTNESSIKTYKQALTTILERGPEVGVHTIIQLDKPVNLLFDDMTAREVFQKFKHLIMLRSDDMAAHRLNLRDDIRLENLSKDSERLRAYYYAEESDNYTLFTPYVTSNKIVNQIENL